MTRRRFRFNEETKQLEEVGLDWTGAERRAQVPTEQLVYGGLGRATDGTPIDSRTKHREYMRANNLALASDYTQTMAKDSAERQRRASGAADRQERREAIGRALHQAERRRK